MIHTCTFKEYLYLWKNLTEKGDGLHKYSPRMQPSGQYVQCKSPHRYVVCVSWVCDQPYPPVAEFSNQVPGR